MIFFPTRIDQYKQPGLQVTAFTKINVVLFCFFVSGKYETELCCRYVYGHINELGGGLTEPDSDY